MGCDIHSYLEVRDSDGTWRHLPDPLKSAPGGPESGPTEPFPYRDYGLFGFLADMRNHSHTPVIAEPRGLPDDVTPAIRSDYESWTGYFAASWLTVAELLAYDYDQVFWDRRIERSYPLPNGGTYTDGAALADEGEGRRLPLREFLPDWYFRRLAEMAKLADDPANVRVVLWFDS